MSEVDAVQMLRQFKPSAEEYRALTVTRWKDGIDVSYPTRTLEAIMQRITELEALLKARDGGRHDTNCPARAGYNDDCGHDAVAKYFEGVGK